jgi:hypothetical protein
MSGLILIVLGVIFLCVNFGLVSWNIFGFLWHFWPVLLILAGLKIMASGSRLARALIELSTVLTVVYLLLFALYVTSPALQETLRPLASYFPSTHFWQSYQSELK